MKNKIFLSFLLLCAYALGVTGQPYCDLKTFSVQDGLVASTISSFAQTSNRVMWFSTINGLNCFDGYAFLTFRNGTNSGDSLTTNRISSIKSNVQDNLWCCTYDRHIYLFDTRQCRFIDVGKIIKNQFGENIIVRNLYPLDNGFTWVVSNEEGAAYRINDTLWGEEGAIQRFDANNKEIRSNAIKKIEIDKSGREWIFDDRGLVLFNSEISSDIPFEYMAEVGSSIVFASPNGHVSIYKDNIKGFQSITFPFVVKRINAMKLCQTKNTIAMATDIGIVLFDVSTKEINVIKTDIQGRKEREVYDLFFDSRGQLWAFTGDNSMILADIGARSATYLQGSNTLKSHGTTSEKPFITEDQHGTIWVIPMKGILSFYDEKEKKLIPYILERGGSRDAYLSYISKHFMDLDGNLWFTGGKDINLVNFRTNFFSFVEVEPNQEVRSLMVDKNGNTWAGTYNGYIVVHSADNQLLGYLTRSGKLSPHKTLFSNHIYALYEDSKERIWIGTKNDGIYLLTKDGKVKHGVFSFEDPQSISDNDIYDILEDGKGRIWIGTFGGGLNLLDSKKDNDLHFKNYRNGLKQYPQRTFDKIRRIARDSLGVIYLSCTDGLITFSEHFDSLENIIFYTTNPTIKGASNEVTTDVMQTLSTSDGKILIVTMSGDIWQMVSPSALSNDLEFRNLNPNRTANDIAQSLVEDASGDIWAIRECSIEKYNTTKNETVQYGPGDIHYDLELTEAKPVFNSVTNRVSFSAYGGYFSFNSTELHRTKEHPGIVFSSVIYQGSREVVPLINCEILHIPSDRRNLTIYFAEPQYCDKYLIRFAYLLEGVDEAWTFLGSSNNISFNHIPPGHHRLLICSTNVDGVWCEEPSVLELYVAPTFWETWVAKVLYILLFFIVLSFIFYTVSLRNRNKLERKMNKMKTNFFADISHRLRTPLTLIGEPVREVLSSEELRPVNRRHLEMVERNSSHMLTLVNKMFDYVMNQDERKKSSPDDILQDDFTVSDVQLNGNTDTEKLDNNPLIEENDIQLKSKEEIVDSDLPSNVATNVPLQDRERILVVEDNDDLRSFLVTILQSNYTVLEAQNGSIGLEIATRDIPDFIITDITMPQMDGLTMVKAIKNNPNICHIPIIVLTAKASLQDRIEGLSHYIDDYITKPFNALYLKSRISNIIRQRHFLQQSYLSQIKSGEDGGNFNSTTSSYKLSSPQIVDFDKEMMSRLMDYLEDHISDASLRIEDLASAVHLGRSVFYSKIRNITGMPPVDFLRYIRIRRAEEYILQSNYPFSQIAYSVGFSDPKYFSKCFRKETGFTPSEYRNKSINTTSEQN